MPDELDALIPVNSSLTLSSGLEIEIEPLRTREMLKLLKIVTHGAGSMLMRIDLTNTNSESEFIGRIMSLVALSVPDSEEETIEFISAMTKPKGLISGKALNKQDTENNVQKWTELRQALDNPELEDLLDIIEAVVKREAPHLAILGKRLGLLLRVAQGQPVKNQQVSAPVMGSQEGSQQPSTGSAEFMAGPIGASWI